MTAIFELSLANALQVFLFDPKIRAWLDANDPKAVEQAKKALEESGYDEPLGLVSPEPRVRHEATRSAMTTPSMK